MKTLLWSAVAAVGLTLGALPQQASAAWVTRPVTRWDPACGRNVVCQERCWVPDCRPCPPRGVRVHHHRHHHVRAHHGHAHVR
jgi:hypothetical protein